MSKPTLTHQIFEIRYERGYRYLDRCGDVMVVLEDSLHAQTGHVWMPEEMTPKGARMKCPGLDLILSFDAARMGLDQIPVTVECAFGDICDLILATITGRFDLKEFIRMGYPTT